MKEIIKTVDLVILKNTVRKRSAKKCLKVNAEDFKICM